MLKSGSAADLRNLSLLQPYANPHTYVNCAVALLPIDVPVENFRNGASNIWDAAQFIQHRLETFKNMKAMAKKGERDATGLSKKWDSDECAAARLPPLDVFPY
jgi:hypothetical protein